LGCPPELELRDTTCADCNNRLGTIDQALLKSFEAISVMYGVPGAPAHCQSCPG